MNDVRAWHETVGATLRRALGIPETDIAERALELLDQAELRHRSNYGTEPPPRQWAFQAGLAAAAVEQFQVIPTTSYQLAESWNRQDPLARIGITPEPASTGFAMRTTANGQVQYTGDPDAIEKMRESFSADAARQAQAAHGESVRLGPLANTVK
jgi:hypothetical protein